MPTKYEVLAALIETDAELRGDPNGYHHVLVDVVEELARERDSCQELIEVLFDLVAYSFVRASEVGPGHP